MSFNVCLIAGRPIQKILSQINLKGILNSTALNHMWLNMLSKNMEILF